MSTDTRDIHNSDANAQGVQHDDGMQLSPLLSDRARGEDSEYKGTHLLPPSHIETIREMKSAHLDYDDRDKGEYEPALKRTRIDKGGDGHDDFYDERPKSPRHQSSRVKKSRRNPSRSQSPTRGRDRSYRRSRSPARGPGHSYAYGIDRNRSRSRSRDRNRSRSRTRRYERSPRDRKGSNARDERGPARYGRGERPNARHSGGGGRSFPEPAQRDAVWAKQDVTQEERKRGQRLFGGLLANLGGPAARSRPAAGRGPASQRSERVPGASERRSSGQLASTEIAHEKPTLPERQRLELDNTSKQDAADKKQTEEDDSKKAAERLAKLDRIRRIEQVRFDEQKMHTLQANELALARSLRTKSKPQLYYHPRDLSKKQEDIIEGQLREAKQNASEQSQNFEREKLERLSALGVRYTPKGSATPEQPQRDNKLVEEAHADIAPLRDLDAMVDEPTAEQVGAVSSSPARSCAPVDGRQEDGSERVDGPKGERNSGDEVEQHEPEELYDHHDDRDKDIMVETEEDTVIY
ncbi:pinin sdk mema domain protein [Ophiostoma piceae UAMH 11346]|uniref:Pinin sdk mema domain protein n=1 Tax=Ophiostoma piceae (strain UAMH 11346) TaxID=1262450 RepID=S3CTJ4_OPHP1|nr:pinin sdk mema domain protein [Ophiostoma piceae UAMH 11346]